MAFVTKLLVSVVQYCISSFFLIHNSKIIHNRSYICGEHNMFFRPFYDSHKIESNKRTYISSLVKKIRTMSPHSKVNVFIWLHLTSHSFTVLSIRYACVCINLPFILVFPCQAQVFEKV